MLTDPAGLSSLTRSINACGIRVHRALGPGLLESAYRLCLLMELQGNGLTTKTEVPVPLVYRGTRLNMAYRLDLLVDEKVVVEVKCVDAIAPIHKATLLTYLRLTGCPVGLIMNFHVPLLKDGIKRVVNPDLLKEEATGALIAPPHSATTE